MSASAVDLDGDGMSDIWERKFGAEHVDPLSDWDGDGLTAAQEATFGTDPFDGRSAVDLDVVRLEDGSTLFTWGEVSGKEYVLEGSGDLLFWGASTIVAPPAPSPLPSGGGGGGDYLDSWVPWASGGVWHESQWYAFYGFDVADQGDPDFGPAADPDGDGLSNEVECRANTNPFDANSRFELSWASAAEAIECRYFGDDGALRYSLKVPVSLGSFDSESAGESGFDPAALPVSGGFVGQPIVPSHTPYRLDASTGEVRTSEGWVEPLGGGPPPQLCDRACSRRRRAIGSGVG